ncbi:MAG: signal recognition particle-docking protein FtsY [Desulfurellaceae bacterium]|nr:signal recognition particle-docking protein FtsY [Desulfurellaceae bacterium]
MALRFWQRKKKTQTTSATPSVADPPVQETTPAPITKDARWRRGLTRLRDLLGRPFSASSEQSKQSRESFFSDLEEVLIQSDVGVETSLQIVDRLRTRTNTARTGKQTQAEAFRSDLKVELRSLLERGAQPAERSDEARPRVILVVGVNGAGKTTSIAKLAARLKKEGKTVLLVAGDTFRAAAIEQLSVWAERLGIDIIKHQDGASPSAVVFDGVRAAVARAVDIVLIDTAGRLHTKTPLMEELKKIHRVIGREIPGAPHEVLLVLDAGTGQNALSQARTFQTAFPLTGVILSKMDGSAKGGVALAVGSQLGVPIQYIGLGEQLEDLEVFSLEDFLTALFDQPIG